MYGFGWFQKIFTTGTSVFLEQQGARSFLTVSAHHPLGLLFYVHWNRRSGGKKKLKSTESIHCIFPIHFFELFPGPDLQKPDIPCYIAIPVIYVDRGQDKLRKSALKKCNVRIRLISKNFYHRNIRFPEATRSKVMCNRVVSSSSWSGVLCPLKPTFWW